LRPDATRKRDEQNSLSFFNHRRGVNISITVVVVIIIIIRSSAIHSSIELFLTTSSFVIIIITIIEECEVSFRGFHFIRVDGFDVDFAQLAPFLFAPENKLSQTSIVFIPKSESGSSRSRSI
jgi:hypothetical protein